MRILTYLIAVLSISLTYFSCEKDPTEIEYETMWISLHNDAHATFCPPERTVTFIISYRDIQVDATINAHASGAINATLSDGESIKVIVQDAQQTMLANSTFKVRTDSRPDDLKNEVRAIQFCKAFDLEFINF